MSKVLKELIRQILTESAKDTGMTASQWWEQKGVEYAGGDADKPYFVYVDKSGEEVIGKKGVAGDPFTYKDLGDGRVLVTSGPDAKSIGSIVPKAGAPRASTATGTDGQPVSTKTSAIAEYITKMSAGLGEILEIIEQLENLRFDLGFGKLGTTLSKKLIFSDRETIESFISLGIALPIANAASSVKKLANGARAEKFEFGSIPDSLAQASPKISQLFASGSKNIKEALKSLESVLAKNKNALRDMSDAEKNDFKAIFEEMRFTALAMNDSSSVPFLALSVFPNQSYAYQQIGPIYYANNSATSSDVKSRSQTLKRQAGLA